MLYTETIRNTLCDENGRALVIINLSYPSVECKKRFGKKKSPFPDRFNPFYRRAAEGFADFAGKELKERAKKNPGDTPPCGAVLHFTADETDDTVTVCLTGSVFDGFDTFPITKDERTWEKKTGLLVG